MDDLKATPTNLLCIAGPTAVGKSATALRLAEELNGEIVSFDSMQVYEGIHIGVAKPSKEESNTVLMRYRWLNHIQALKDEIQISLQNLLN